MSAPGLTTEAQLRYMLQWFGEFSELQKEDFLPVIAAAKSGKPDQLAATLASLSCQDKPVSLFQCRIKLFNEWYPTWSEKEQERLFKGVSEMDSEFEKKVQELLTNGLHLNGDHNGTNESISPTEEKVDEIINTDNKEQEPEQSTLPQENNVPFEIVAAS